MLTVFAVAAGIILALMIVQYREVLWAVTWWVFKLLFTICFFIGIAIVTG